VKTSPVIDVEADYEAAQQFSVSEVDRAGAGAEAAEAATAPQFERQEHNRYPDDFLAMATTLLLRLKMSPMFLMIY